MLRPHCSVHTIAPDHRNVIQRTHVSSPIPTTFVAQMPASRLPFQLETMVSGGELGADRAALDFAIANSIRHFGFCGCGRPSEDGRIPLRYTVIETVSHGPSEAIFLNVSASDGTILFDPIPQHQSLRSTLTLTSCDRTRRPILTLQSYFDAEADARQLANFLKELRPSSLYISGRSESETPGIYEHVLTVLKLTPITAAPEAKARIGLHTTAVDSKSARILPPEQHKEL